MLESIQDVSAYLRTFGPALATRIQEEFQPLFNPGETWDPNFRNLLREPFQAQGDVVMALVKTLEKRRSVVVVGEMGAGKSLIGACVPYLSQNNGRPMRTLVMCPGHLVQKWCREVRQTIPGAKTFILRRLEDLLKVNPTEKPKTPEYFVMSKEKAKLGYAWKPAFCTRNGNEEAFCPGCGEALLDRNGVPIPKAAFERNRRFCPECNEALWQADNKKCRRFPLAEYIKKRLRGYFDFFIADEVHELKGGSTAQGNCLGALASSCKKSIALTGTLLGGYADDIFYVCYRLSPTTMKQDGLGYHGVTSWMARYGVLERITRHYPEDNLRSRGKKSQTIAKRKPGVSPAVFSRHLLDKAVFLHLEDIALELPLIEEKVVNVGMDAVLGTAYKALENVLIQAVREALAKGSKALLGTYLNALLSYPDRPFETAPILDPRNGQVIALPQELSQQTVYAKEQELLRLVEEEIANKRHVFVYCQYTSTKDVTERLSKLIRERGFRVCILRSSVQPEKREEWLAEKVEEGIQVVVANPKLVETGLDLLSFPTLIFYQTGYSVFTLRQASRRSWRIGQKHPVCIYYLFYAGTMQEKALQLMGSKLEASLAIEGKFSDQGLLALTSGEDMSTLMAKALVEGLEVEAAEHVWRKINEANREKVSKAQIPLVEPVPELPPEEGDKVVYVDFVTFLGRRRKKVERVAAKASELDAVLQEKEAGTAQISLFP